MLFYNVAAVALLAHAGLKPLNFRHRPLAGYRPARVASGLVDRRPHEMKATCGVAQSVGSVAPVLRKVRLRFLDTFWLRYPETRGQAARHCSRQRLSATREGNTKVLAKNATAASSDYPPAFFFLSVTSESYPPI
jgi:hypothetical protein